MSIDSDQTCTDVNAARPVAATRSGYHSAMPFDSGTRPLPPSDWLLAETLRRAEEARGEFTLDDAATRAAREVDGDPAARIVARARLAPGSEGMLTDISRARGLARALGIALLLLGAVLGALAAGGVETSTGTIALSYALLVLLLVPSLLLLGWAVLSLWPGPPRAGLPGRAAGRLLTTLIRRLGHAGHREHLAAALGSLIRARGRTLLALATHGFWSGFFIGALVWLWLRFLGLRFDFSWETTLLSGDWLESVIIAIGTLPHWLLGVAAPDPEQARTVLTGRSDAANRALWANYLLAALLLYGLLPRLLLAIGFWLGWRRARMRLDLGAPGYLRLLPVLSGRSAEGGGRMGARPAERVFNAATGAPRADPGHGDPVLIGVELERDRDRWPPDDATCRVLGQADNRDQRRALIDALAALEPRPSEIVARCSALRTPDRGTGLWLTELAGVAPVRIELEDLSQLARRDIDPDRRLEDWRGLAQRYELPLTPLEQEPESPADPEDPREY